MTKGEMRGDDAYSGMTDADGAAIVKTPLGNKSKLGLLNFNVAHDNEMYGTIAVYLRLKGLVLPSTEDAAASQKAKYASLRRRNGRTNEATRAATSLARVRRKPTTDGVKKTLALRHLPINSVARSCSGRRGQRRTLPEMK